MRIHCSMDRPVDFKEGDPPFQKSVQQDEPDSATPSCVSMKSHWSVDRLINFQRGDFPDLRSVQQDEPDSATPSCVSMKSHWSVDRPINFQRGDFPDLRSVQQDEPDLAMPSCVSMKSHCSVDRPIDFKEKGFPYLKRNLRAAETQELNCDHSFCKLGISTYRGQSGVAGQSACPICLNRSSIRPALHQHKEPVCALDDVQQRVIERHRTSLKNKYEYLFEGNSSCRNIALLNGIYTELYITEEEREGVNEQHEVLQIETAHRGSKDKPINCNDIFKSATYSGPKGEIQDRIRTVLTKGIAGIGKTISVQKFILDWAEGKANQDVDLMCVLPLRGLNLLKDCQYSLHQLLLQCHPELKELDPKVYDICKIVLIFDGLDEGRFQFVELKESNTKKVFDATVVSSVGMLTTNLIEGNLLPSAHIWVTSRPAAANQIPPGFISRVTEVQGFSDSQKEEYFRRSVRDQNLARKIISHIKTSRSLYIMCHIPVFCWISATVMQYKLQKGNCQETPKTLTEMYVHFILIQIRVKKMKFEGQDVTDPKELLQSNKDVLLKLAKLAFKQLLRQNIMFYEEDLAECDINVTEAAVCTGILTEIFKEESVLSGGKVYSFVHLSVQEFFAALYVFKCYSRKDMAALKHFLDRHQKRFLRENRETFLGTSTENVSLDMLLKAAVENALQSKNGHLDLFVRFLYGISVESNQKLLHGVLTPTEKNTDSIQRASKYLKQMLKWTEHAERSINLLHCLTEINDDSIHVEIQALLNSNQFSAEISVAHCSELAYMHLTSEKVLDKLDLQEYNTSEEGRRRLIPAVRCCRKALLASCNLSKEPYETLASALKTPHSHLTELDLSYNDLRDSGMELLSAGLLSSNSKLQILRLAGCNLTKDTCKTLASALMAPSSHLTELDLSYNDLQDSGVKLLSAGLLCANSKLQILRLVCCNLTSASCEVLASGLSSEFSDLRELDLTNNDLHDSGVERLSLGLGSSNCKVGKLRLSGCLVTKDGCSSLASALSSNPSHLTELDLSYNHLGDAGVKQLTAERDNERNKLEMLNVDHGAEIWKKPGLRKYACELTLDPNTANTRLTLSEGNRKATCGQQNDHPDNPDHSDRFLRWPQVLCRESVTGRCYWEVEHNDRAYIAVAYKGTGRKGGRRHCEFGFNAQSWSLRCHGNSYSAWHNNKSTEVPALPSPSCRVGVYLDQLAGILSFYSVSSHRHTLSHIHTFHATFTEPLHPGFTVWGEGSVSLCQVKEFVQTHTM